MDEKTLLTEILRILAGSLSLLSSVVLAAILLKKYVINGNLSRFPVLKEQEIDALKGLQDGLQAILREQERLFEAVNNANSKHL